MQKSEIDDNLHQPVQSKRPSRDRRQKSRSMTPDEYGSMIEQRQASTESVETSLNDLHEINQALSRKTKPSTHSRKGKPAKQADSVSGYNHQNQRRLPWGSFQYAVTFDDPMTYERLENPMT